MMSHIAQWFSGITFAVIWIKESVSVCKSSTACDLIQINEKKGINCSHRDVMKVPQPADFCLVNGEEIVFLDLSNNAKLYVYDDDMKNYPALETLIMSWSSSLSHFTDKFFEPLVAIDNLYMDGVNLHDESGSYGKILPAQLLTCSINYCHITNIDLSHLEDLNALFIAYNDLTDIPNIPKEAPLMEIDLRMNPMNDLEYSDIAPFCLLTYLVIELPEHSELNTSAKYFECCQLEMWIKDNNISGTVSLNCTEVHGILDGEKCVYQNTTRKMSALKEREACFFRYGYTNEFSGFWFYFTNICIALTLIIAMSFVVYRYFVKHGVFVEKEELPLTPVSQTPSRMQIER